MVEQQLGNAHDALIAIEKYAEARDDGPCSDGFNAVKEMARDGLFTEIAVPAHPEVEGERVECSCEPIVPLSAEPQQPEGEPERWRSDFDFTIGQLRGAREVIDSGTEIDRQRLHDLLAAVVPRLEEVKESAAASYDALSERLAAAERLLSDAALTIETAVQQRQLVEDVTTDNARLSERLVKTEKYAKKQETLHNDTKRHWESAEARLAELVEAVRLHEQATKARTIAQSRTEDSRLYEAALRAAADRAGD